jgi:hypothetical protein
VGANEGEMMHDEVVPGNLVTPWCGVGEYITLWDNNDYLDNDTVRPKGKLCHRRAALVIAIVDDKALILECGSGIFGWASQHLLKKVG